MKKLLFLFCCFLICGNNVNAEEDFNKTKFEIIDTKAKTTYYSNRIKVDEDNNTITFEILCNNNKPCKKVINANPNDFIIFLDRKEIEVSNNGK